jgi:hypothetical protein
MGLTRPITIEGHRADFGVRDDDREYDVAVEVGTKPIAGTEGRARKAGTGCRWKRRVNMVDSGITVRCRRHG